MTETEPSGTPGSSSQSVPKWMSRAATVVVAFMVFAGGAVFLWRAFASGPVPARVWQDGYPSPPASGYYILLPDQAEQGSEFETRVTALTNLPDGTLLDITTTNEGTCCVPVKDSMIPFTTQDSSCYGNVGQQPDGAAFDVTITAKPDFEPWVLPGIDSSDAPQQPDSVLKILGERFEHLSGDQVVEQEDGSKRLVSKGTVPWPEPRCGGDAIPQFGGPECNPDDFQQQLQSNDLEGAIGEPVGTIQQGRMCEFWSVMLPPGVEQEHPWPEFAAEWREWLLRQDFSHVEPYGESVLRGLPVGHEGSVTVVDLLLDGRRIATFEVQPLPDYCERCGPNVVPFWGVIDWQLYP